MQHNILKLFRIKEQNLIGFQHRLKLRQRYIKIFFFLIRKHHKTPTFIYNKITTKYLDYRLRQTNVLNNFINNYQGLFLPEFRLKCPKLSDNLLLFLVRKSSAVV